MTSPPRNVLGTLVHRAVLAPFTKPWFRAAAWKPWCYSFDLCEEITASTSRLADAMEGLIPSAGREPRLSRIERARNVVDVGGYVWSKTVDDFLSLELADRKWVIRELTPLADRARSAIVRDAKESGWLWVVSESPMYMMSNGRPRQKRPDLIVRTKTTVEVIDLKTGWPTQQDEKDLHTYAKNHPLVVASTGMQILCWFLRASARSDEDPWIPLTEASAGAASG